MRKILATAAVAVALFAIPGMGTTFNGYNVNLVNGLGTAPSVLGNGDLELVNGYGGENAAWLTSPLSTGSFSATFSFSLASLPGFPYPMADGISFALQNMGTNVVGNGGGDVGYTGLNGVGSVIQTWQNNTAGLNTDGDAYDTQAAPANLGTASVVTGTETVSYDASTFLMSMIGTLNVDGTPYGISDLAPVDLNTLFGPTMYVGFTGGSGLGGSDELITSFNLNPLAPPPVPEPGTLALFGSGLFGLAGAVRRRMNK